MCRFNIIPTNIPAGVFAVTEADPKIHRKIKGSRIANIVLREKMMTHTSWFQNLLQNYSNQDSVVLA